jgi:hypothetical protein
MKRLACFVNLLFATRFTLQQLETDALFCEGANYSKPAPIPQVPLHNIAEASG